MVSPIATFSVLLKDGRVWKAGKLSEILQGDKSLGQEAALGRQIIERTKEEIDHNKSIDKPATGKLIVTEEIASGHVSFAVGRWYETSRVKPNLHFAVKDFLWQMGGHRPFLTLIAYTLAGIISHLFYVGQVLYSFSTHEHGLINRQPWYLGYWSSQYMKKRGEEVNSAWYELFGPRSSMLRNLSSGT